MPIIWINWTNIVYLDLDLTYIFILILRLCVCMCIIWVSTCICSVYKVCLWKNLHAKLCLYTNIETNKKNRAMWFTKKNRKICLTNDIDCNIPHRYRLRRDLKTETKLQLRFCFIWRARAHTYTRTRTHIHTLHTHHIYNILLGFFFQVKKKKNIQILSLVHDFCIVCGFDFFRIRLRWRRCYNIHLWIIIIHIRHIRFRWMLIISQSSQFTFAGRIQLTFKLSNCCTK